MKMESRDRGVQWLHSRVKLNPKPSARLNEEHWALEDRTERSIETRGDVANKMTLRRNIRKHKALASPETARQSRHFHFVLCLRACILAKPPQFMLTGVQSARAKHSSPLKPACVRNEAPVLAF